MNDTKEYFGKDNSKGIILWSNLLCWVFWVMAPLRKQNKNVGLSNGGISKWLYFIIVKFQKYVNFYWLNQCMTFWDIISVEKKLKRVQYNFRKLNLEHLNMNIFSLHQTHWLDDNEISTIYQILKLIQLRKLFMGRLFLPIKVVLHLGRHKVWLSDKFV